MNFLENIDLTLQICPGSDSLLRDGSSVAAIVSPKYANRLAACWKACRGISQKSLDENGVASFESVVVMREYELKNALQEILDPMPAYELKKALQEIVTRLQNHPAYQELTIEEEVEMGGDTAEFSFLVRIGNEALNKLKD